MSKIQGPVFKGRVYVWKNEGIYKACFIYPDKLRSYVVLNDRSPTKELINHRITTLAKAGFYVTVGLPPEPNNLKIVKEIVDAVKEKK